MTDMCQCFLSRKSQSRMSPESDVTESPFVQDADDTKSEATEEFVVVDSEAAQEPDSTSVTDLSARKTATVVLGESEEEDDEEGEIVEDEGDNLLADYPDDTEAWSFLYQLCLAHTLMFSRSLSLYTRGSPHAHH